MRCRSSASRAARRDADTCSRGGGEEEEEEEVVVVDLIVFNDTKEGLRDECAVLKQGSVRV